MGKKPSMISLEASKEEAKRLRAALKEARELPKSKVKLGKPDIKRKSCLLL